MYEGCHHVSASKASYCHIFSFYRIQPDVCASYIQKVFFCNQANLHSSIFKSKYLIHRDIVVSPFSHHKYPLRCISVTNFSLSLQTSYSLILNNRLAVQSSSSLYRNYQTSSNLKKEESKVEKSVKALQDSAEEESEKKQIVSFEEKAVEPPKKTLKQRFIAVVKHYYHGFRLLLSDVRISRRLLWRILKGKTLTRREHNQVSYNYK